MLDNDPLWYRDAIIYEVHVRAFHDSAGDGQGDFRGLTQKLDYLEDLGITAIWLLPFYPSPLRDDGYDIADYTDINPMYGRLEDFKEFLQEAHRRGLRVITELVINHTSDQHPWFQRARVAPPGSVERDFYVWSDTPDRYRDARIIFKDFERSNWTWDPVANAYYWHRFYSHQPDLNYDNPAVKAAIFPVLDMWLEMGVDGLRLDAVPYLFEREGTNCENLPETHGFLKELRAHADARFTNRMFLAEANQWPEDAVAYFGNGDECHMAFHFPLMPRLFMALHREDRFPIVDILAQTPAIPANCQWCQFLRNHDELTLEMVTDEERDSMYRAYARDRQARINLGIRRRLAPLLRNDRRRIELMNALLFSLPGAPVIYYGDEIGMGDNIYLGDRNGVRTPMQWSPDRNAGFSRANPQKLYLPVIIDPEYHFESINVEAQQNNPTSLLWWMKRLIALRKRFKAFSRGTLEVLEPNNPKILAFIREFGDERILVVANLSRFVRYVELNLKKYQGMVLQELFSGNEFPPIGDLPYLLTLTPHAFYWFALAPSISTKRARSATLVGRELPLMRVKGGWEGLFHSSNLPLLETLLPDFLARRRMSPGPGQVLSAAIEEVQSLLPTRKKEGGIAPFTPPDVRLLVLHLEYDTGDTETTLLPLMPVAEDQIPQLLEAVESAGLVRLGLPPAPEGPGREGPTFVVCDALTVPDYCRGLLRMIGAGIRQPFRDGELVAVALPGFAETCGDQTDLKPVHNPGERNDPSILFDRRAIYKAYRQLEAGINPDLEMTLFLTAPVDKGEPGVSATGGPRFSGVAPPLGYFEYRRPGAEPTSMAVLHRYVPNQGDAWQVTLDQLSSYLDRVLALPGVKRDHAPPPGRLLGPIPAPTEKDDLAELIGPYLPMARLMGECLGGLHRALASDRTNPAFAPEPFSRPYQRSVYQSMRNLVGQLLESLCAGLDGLEASVQVQARQLQEQESQLLKRFRTVLDRSLGGQRIRCHGNLRLHQLLWTGSSFVIIGFEGDPTRPVSERRIKRSPFRDLAELIHSLHMAVGVSMRGLSSEHGKAPGLVRPEDRAALQPWAAAWHGRVTRELATAYLEQAGDLGPQTPEARLALLEVVLLECALREIIENLVHRPDWVAVPLAEALRLLLQNE